MAEQTEVVAARIPPYVRIRLERIRQELNLPNYSQTIRTLIMNYTFVNEPYVPVRKEDKK